MARTTKRIKPALAIVQLDNVPGPEADSATLNAHYQRVQNQFAVHRYDDVIMSCHWCCDSENDLVFAKPDKARGTRVFCSARCANSWSAYETKVWGGAAKPVMGGKGRPDKAEETLDDSHDAVPTERVKAKRPVRATVKAASPPPEGGEVDEEQTDWKPLGQRERKPRKARAAKPMRTDGKCPKGLHEMTEANTYTYKDKTWCRECRKESRAKSANGGKA